MAVGTVATVTVVLVDVVLTYVDVDDVKNVLVVKSVIVVEARTGVITVVTVCESWRHACFRS